MKNQNEAQIYLKYLTSEVMKRVFAEYADGESLQSIISRLASGHIYAPPHDRFNYNTFCKALSNRKYLGEYVYNGEIYTNIYPQIIDAETFNKVEERRKMNKRYAPAERAKVDYGLQGKSGCGHCGSQRKGDCGTSKTGEVYNYYSCAKHKKKNACKKFDTNDNKGGGSAFAVGFEASLTNAVYYDEILKGVN